MPSVTSICRLLDNYGLNIWRVNVALDALVASIRAGGQCTGEEIEAAKNASAVVSEAATAFGTAVHQAIHRESTGQEQPELADDVRRALESWRAWSVDVGFVPQLTEEVVGHPVQKYAGTMDCLGTVNGVPTVIDYKTTDSAQHRIYPETAMQLAAYAKAANALSLAELPQ